MAIGQRIQERLDQLGWKQKDLADASAQHTEKPLSIQTISNLIRRDSKRSEQDEIIAKTLGVDLFWLVYGRRDTSTQYAAPPKTNITPLHTSEPTLIYGAIGELVEAAKMLNENGVRELIGQARMLKNIHPRSKQNLAS
jgi:transcriptional regulator with XRE-family HTH domain